MDVLNPLEFSRNDGSKFSGLIYHKVSCPVFSQYFVSVSTEVSVERGEVVTSHCRCSKRTNHGPANMADDMKKNLHL